MKRIMLFIFLIAYLIVVIGVLIGYNLYHSSAREGPYNVVVVTSGNNMVIDKDGEQRRILLIGVDCESLPSEYKEEAKEYVESLLEGNEIRLEYDKVRTDKFSIYIADYVYAYTQDGRMINALMLDQGLAKHDTMSPNTKYDNSFSELEQKAKERKVGVWEIE